MDQKTKRDLLSFIGTGLSQVGDLATWIQSPQRRYHRHELFGVKFATLQLPGSKNLFTLRDIGYGGIGLVGDSRWAQKSGKAEERVQATLTILGASMPFTLIVRHVQPLHIGCEFVDMQDDHHKFLKNYIQFMDAALNIRQSEMDQVFPAFRDREWLNLMGHRGSLRFHIRRKATHAFDATLVFIINQQHIFCSWHDAKVEVGLLNGEPLGTDDQREVLRQIICILVGIRQGASLPDFALVIEQAVALYTR